jgi:hypothetical protein
MPTDRIDWRRAAAEIALLVAAGLFMGAIGPYFTARYAAGTRYPYWLVAMVGGGLIGIVIDAAIGRRLEPLWWRLLTVSALMTPPVALLVIVDGHLLANGEVGLGAWLDRLWQVFVIALPVMTVRALAWREPRREIANETRTVIAPPLPEAEAAFRQRLSAKRRAARLIAIEAHDHYLKVHTDQGVELVTMRFADALAELALAHGHRLHRSWWVAADAIEAVQWRRGGSGEARLVDDLTAPVSRAHAAALKAAGWF